MCCPTCGCLGYCSNRESEKLYLSGFKVLSNRSFEDLRLSAEKGCVFCSFAFQGSALLRSAGSNPPIEIEIYTGVPTEIHSLSVNEKYDVVEIYASSKHIDVPYPKLGNDVPKEPNSKQSLQFLESQYNSCLLEHEACRQGSTILPKRVVDISDSRYRLVEPESGVKGTYAALSYSWGNRGFQVCTSKSYDTLKRGIDRDSLAMVFQDAAIIAQRLNISYLWIDTLCIIQDSKIDWEEEAAKMADIFGNATITIAASSSPNPAVSIFTRRQSSNQELELIEKVSGQVRSTVFKARRKIALGLHAKILWSTEADPLDLRAWALQEKELSTRFISFTGAELQWTCKSVKACECHQIPCPSRDCFNPSMTNVCNGTNANYFVGWNRVVEEYSSRTLSVIEDKLPALMGLANKFHALTGFTYVAGLWQENLLSDLVWQRHSEQSLAPPACYLAPTFSWVSVPGSVNFQLGRHSYDGTRIPQSKLLRVHYATADGNPYSRATQGSLIVRGRTLSARLRSSISTDPQAYKICIGDAVYSPCTNQRTTCEFAIDTPLDSFSTGVSEGSIEEVALARSSKETAVEVEGSIKLLSLYSIHHDTYLYENFLILGRSRMDIRSYERLGIGTGKIYNDQGLSSNSCSQSGCAKPFQWLLVDLERRGRIIEKVVEEVIRIV